MKARKYTNQVILAWVIILGFFSLTVYMVKLASDGTPVSDTTGSVFMLMGTVATAFGIVVQYFFGSTRGSADKTDAIVQLAKPKNPVPDEEAK